MTAPLVRGRASPGSAKLFLHSRWLISDNTFWRFLTRFSVILRIGRRPSEPSAELLALKLPFILPMLLISAGFLRGVVIPRLPFLG